MSDMFDVTEKNGLLLTVPTFEGNNQNSAWNIANQWFRSRVTTLDGTLVSQGMGKFFNLGQGPSELQVTFDDISNAILLGKEVFATLKYDGSLLIRSVHNGQVYLRTRGSHGYESLENAHEIERFRALYPRLFDPNYYKDYSLHFEWLSPENQIVIRYDSPRLILISAVEHTEHLRYSPLRTLELIAKNLEVDLVQYYQLTDSNSWQDLYETLQNDQDIEGYVIRLYGEQRLVKIKAPAYLTKHALRSNLSVEKLIELYLQWDKPSFASFKEKFTLAFDEECTTWAFPLMSIMYDGIKAYDAQFAHLDAKYKQNKLLSRKDYAILMQSAYGQTKWFAMAMNLYLGKPVLPETEKWLILQKTGNKQISFLKNIDNNERPPSE